MSFLSALVARGRDARPPAALDPGRYPTPEAYAFGLMRAAVPTDEARELLRAAVRRLEAETLAGPRPESDRSANRRAAQREAAALASRQLLREVAYVDPDPELLPPTPVPELWRPDGQPVRPLPRDPLLDGPRSG